MTSQGVSQSKYFLRLMRKFSSVTKTALEKSHSEKMLLHLARAIQQLLGSLLQLLPDFKKTIYFYGNVPFPPSPTHAGGKDNQICCSSVYKGEVSVPHGPGT